MFLLTLIACAWPIYAIYWISCDVYACWQELYGPQTNFLSS